MNITGSASGTAEKLSKHFSDLSLWHEFLSGCFSSFQGRFIARFASTLTRTGVS